MSEFSSSIHILNSSEDDVITLLETNELSGIIIGSNDSTTTLLVEEDTFEEIQSRTSCITYLFAEDHGLVMSFISEGREIGGLSFQWGEDLSFEVSNKLEIELFKHKLIPQEKVFILKQALMQVDVTNFDWDTLYPTVTRFAELFELFAYDTLSWGYFNRHKEVYLEQYPHLIVINN